MRHLRNSVRRMTIALLWIVLPLAVPGCSGTRLPQANGPTATSTPKGSQGNLLVDTPTATSSAGNVPSRPTAPTTPDYSKFSLQISWHGTFSQVGGLLAQYGPDTATVTLNQAAANSYAGSYNGDFHGTLSGFCNAAVTWPVSFEVTASGHASGDLDLTVKSTVAKPTTVGSCQGLSGSPRVGAIIVAPQSFTLPAEGGASKTWTADPITWTYTLKKQAP
jgi:hypothetical protein